MIKLLGNNKLSSSKLFYWRDKYINVAPELNTIDMWYDDSFYGKVDNEHISIYPNEDYLTQLQSTKTIFVINFVADAWQDFKQHINKSIMAGEIKKDSFYALSRPQNGWENINNFYDNWTDALYEVFVDNFIDQERDKRIINFKEFINVYLEFVDKMSKDFPFTKESLILSRWASPRTSGLIIEIAEAAHDVDTVKLKFLMDRSYSRVVTIAEQYGFKIDKNAPWRFVADLDSIKMKHYINAQNFTNKEDVLNRAYIKAYETGLETFKHSVWKWYSEFVSLKPTIHAVVSKTCKSLSVIKNREVISEEEAMERFSDEFWIRLYTYVRAKELNKSWKQSEFNEIVKKASTLNQLTSEAAGMEHISQATAKDERNTYTKEENDVILKERSYNRGKGTFKF